MTDSERCPGCGADWIRDPDWNPAYACGSHDDRRGALCETPRCLRKQLAQLRKETDDLRVAVNHARAFLRAWQPDQPGTMTRQFGKMIGELDKAAEETKP